MQSPILKNLLTNPAFSEFHSKTVNLPTISTPTLNKIVEYLYFKKRSIEQDRIDWINDFVIDPKEAVDLLQAADFLDIWDVCQLS